MFMTSQLRFCVPIILCNLVVCVSASAQNGLQLFHQMQKALGGADQLAAVRDFEERVHAITWNNEGMQNGEEHKRTRWIRPNYLRLDQLGHDNNTYSLYFNGRSGWEILPDKSVLALVGDELKFAKGYLAGIHLKIWLADHNPRYLISSPGPNVVRIADKNDSHNTQDFTLDPTSSLPVKQTHVPRKGAPESVQEETRFEDWRLVQGIQFPHRISILRAGAKIAVITVDQIKLDGGLKPDDLAKKPRDLNPDLGTQ
jgi:hypothetical protein